MSWVLVKGTNNDYHSQTLRQQLKNKQGLEWCLRVEQVDSFSYIFISYYDRFVIFPLEHIL